MKCFVLILCAAVSVYAAHPEPQVDADKLAIVQAQLELANLTIQILQAQQAATEKIVSALAVRAKRLGCPGSLDAISLQCAVAPKAPKH
jgi:hypothetical protein